MLPYLLSLLTAGLNFFGNVYSNQKNQEIADNNNDFNYKMMQEQNVYNSPVNQRSRLEQAGINPALALSSISPGVSQGITASNNQPVVNPFQGVDFNGLSSQIAQNKLIDAQVEKTKAETAGILAGNPYIPSEKKTQIAQMQSNIDFTNVQSKASLLSMKLTDANIGFVKQNTKNAEQAWQRAEMMNPLEAQSLKAQINNTVANTKYVLQDMDLSKKVTEANLSQVYVNVRLMSEALKGASIENRYKPAILRSELLNMSVGRRATESQINKTVEEIKSIKLDRIYDGINTGINAIKGISDVTLDIVGAVATSGGSAAAKTIIESLKKDPKKISSLENKVKNDFRNLNKSYKPYRR